MNISEKKKMNQNLPGGCNYFATCGARIREIKAIESQLENCEHGLRAFQKLPRNMQRRAVSNNVQRLPHSLREKHKREIGNKVKINRRPCRKYRRRPSNLLKEYNRRQKDYIWLESHIWHAKRFHMIKKWGYHLPRTPTNKSVHASVRAATETCLIQDVSYENCFEIQGPFEKIYDPLLAIIHPENVQSCRDPEAVEGKYWVQTTFYKRNMFPYGVIGDVQLIWSSYNWNEPLYKLWVWAHPSISKEVLSELIEVFKYEKIDAEASEKSPIRVYVSEFTKLFDLSNTLVKLKLTGPKSYSILKNVLVPSDVVLKGEHLLKTSEDKKKTPWWISFFLDSSHLKTNECYNKLWKNLSSSTFVAKRLFSLVIRDVRSILPSSKIPFQEDSLCENQVQIEPCTEPVSEVHPIFSSSIRESVTNSMKTTHEINHFRSKFTIPGNELPITEDESRVPVLILNHPVSRASGIGSGWEVILPSGWGPSMLITLKMNGGVVGGQEEARALEREFLSRPLPQNQPDTLAGRREMEAKILEKEEEYFRKPPNCRENYIKFGTQFPFGVKWIKLLKSWNKNCENYYVLRDKEYLEFLSSITCKKLSKVAKRKFGTNKPEMLQGSENDNVKSEESLIPSNLKYSLKNYDKIDLNDVLIYVRVVLIGKGSLESCAMICLPTKDDLENSFGMTSTSSELIVEPAHEDSKASKRSALKEEHKRNLNLLKRKRKKARSAVLCSEKDPLGSHPSIQKAIAAAVKASNEKNIDIIKDVEMHKAKMEKLWLPDSDEEVIQSCARRIFGYLSDGKFCMRLGRSGGVGYVVASPLMQHLKEIGIFQNPDGAENPSVEFANRQVVVLVRNPSSSRYQWARLIVLNI